MEWTDMRESFCAVLLLSLPSNPEKSQESSASGTSTVSAGPVTFLERQDARVRLRDPTWTDRLAESLGARVT
jgi:hypothetical protein